MRIAIISEVFLPKIDGVVNRTLNLIRQLVRLGDEVLVVCPQAQGCTNCPVPVMGVPSFAFRPYPEYRIGLPDQRVAEALKQFAPDVIHYVNPFAFGFRCHDVLRRAGVRTPSVFSFHTLYGEFAKKYRTLKALSALLWWLTREYHNRADVNLTVSSVMQADLVRRGFRRVELWPPAVDTELFHPRRKSASMRAMLSNGRPERPLLLTVSRLAPGEERRLPGRGTRSIPRRLPGHRRRRAATNGDLERRFNGNATFVGYLKGEELASAYASADAFVYASETETMGNVVLEAMAAGCPVVAPHAGGIPSLISHGNTGFLFPPGDLKQAVHLIRTVLADQELHSRVVQAARSEVAERGWEHSIGRVRQVYTEAIHEAQRPDARWTWQPVAQLTMLALVSLFRKLATNTKRRVKPRTQDAEALAIVSHQPIEVPLQPA